AVHKAAEKVREKVVQIGAHLLEASPADVVVENGKVFVKGVPEKAKNFGDISMAAYLANNLPDGMEPGLEATVYYDPPNFTFPFGVTGYGEAAADGLAAAAAKPVINTLSPLGVKHIDMPLTTEKISRAIRAAGEGRR